jgi:hypothetical protein
MATWPPPQRRRSGKRCSAMADRAVPGPSVRVIADRAASGARAGHRGVTRPAPRQDRGVEDGLSGFSRPARSRSLLQTPGSCAAWHLPFPQKDRTCRPTRGGGTAPYRKWLDPARGRGRGGDGKRKEEKLAKRREAREQQPKPETRAGKGSQKTARAGEGRGRDW